MTRTSNFGWHTCSTATVTGISTPQCGKSRQTRNRLNPSLSTEQSLVWIWASTTLPLLRQGGSGRQTSSTVQVREPRGLQRCKEHRFAVSPSSAKRRRWRRTRRCALESRDAERERGVRTPCLYSGIERESTRKPGGRTENRRSSVMTKGLRPFEPLDPEVIYHGRSCKARRFI